MIQWKFSEQQQSAQIRSAYTPISLSLALNIVNITFKTKRTEGGKQQEYYKSINLLRTGDLKS